MSERSRGRLDEQESPAEPNLLPYEATPNVTSYREHETNGSYREHKTTGSYREIQTTNSYRESDTQKDSTSSDSAEFLSWKAAGRPDCPRCLKWHCGDCRGLTKKESDLLQRDPEGYARYRKMMKKPRSRRGQGVGNTKSKSRRHPLQQDETTAAQYVPDLERPLERDATTAVHYVSTLQQLVENSPWMIEKAAAIISRCSPSELQDLMRYLETQPHFAVVARMAADSIQRLKVASSSIVESQRSNDIQETDAPQAPDWTTAADTSHNNGPSVDFHTGTELARSLEQGGPSTNAEGKKPKK